MAIDYVFVSIDQSAIGVRFDQNVKVSSLTNDKFKLYLDGATPSLISDAFEEIDTYEDFDTIRRILTLRPKALMAAETDYLLTTHGIEYAGYGVGEDDSYQFTTDKEVNPSVEEAALQPVQIEDHSIKSTASITYSETVGDSAVSEFHVVSTDPESGDFYVEPDYENGRLTIVFSSTPDTDFLNDDYIKVQRKKNQSAPTRWEKVPVTFSIAANEPWVYVRFPAIEDSTVYREAGYTYFEENYTYRVRLSRYIKAA